MLRKSVRFEYEKDGVNYNFSKWKLKSSSLVVVPSTSRTDSSSALRKPAFNAFAMECVVASPISDGYTLVQIFIPSTNRTGLFDSYEWFRNKWVFRFWKRKPVWICHLNIVNETCASLTGYPSISSNTDLLSKNDSDIVKIIRIHFRICCWNMEYFNNLISNQRNVKNCCIFCSVHRIGHCRWVPTRGKNGN